MLHRQALFVIIGGLLLASIVAVLVVYPFDYLINVKAVRGWINGLPLYYSTNDTHVMLFSSFISTPVVALLHVPFSLLSDELGLWLFRIGSLICYIGAILLLARIHNTGSQRPSNAILLVVISMTWLPLAETLALGQLNAILVLALAISYYGYGRNCDPVAGIGLGVAIALKLTPAPIILCFVLQRRWRAAFYTILSTGVIFGLSSAAVGSTNFETFMLQIAPALSQGTPNYYNQNLNGIVYRFLIEGKVHTWFELDVPPFMTSMATFTTISAILCAGVMVALTTYLYLPRWRTRSSSSAMQTQDAQFAFTMWLTLLVVVNPLTWWHYLTILIIPVILILTEHLRGRPKWYQVLILLALFMINIRYESILPFIVGPLLENPLTPGVRLLTDLLISLNAVGAFLLWVALILISRYDRVKMA